MEKKQRIITAAIGIPLFLLMIILGGWWLGGLLIILGMLGAYEYVRMVQKIPSQQPYMWYICGFLYIAAGFLAFYGLRDPEAIAYGVKAVFWLLIVIWITDTAAYEIGIRYGRQKLAPKISPHKTVEGAVAGLIAALIFGGGYAWLVMGINIIAALFISLLISCIGQIGDLAESRVKRLAGVKDSGKLLPGHGGVLDRFDSILLSSIFLYIFLLVL